MFFHGAMDLADLVAPSIWISVAEIKNWLTGGTGLEYGVGSA